MDIEKVLKNLRLIQAVLGVSKKEFESLLPVFEQVIKEDKESKKRKRKIGGGSNGNIKNPIKKLFFILWYIKVYPTFDVAAYVFNSSKSRTHIWAHKILPLLEKALGKKILLPKRRISTPEEFLALFPFTKEVMLDGVERPTIRSRKSKTQNKHYSGKNKRHTRKNLVVVNSKRKILILTPSKHGKVHDKKINDKNILASRIPENVSILADTGFIGIQKQHQNVLIPKKKPKGDVLSDFDKEMNRLISSV
ncbi:MAG: transposase [Proteobacteria bacterium]|nr:transposase [Pseudomonadota bacterium]